MNKNEAYLHYTREQIQKLENLANREEEDDFHRVPGHTRHLKQFDEDGNEFDLKIDNQFRYGMELIKNSLIEDLCDPQEPVVIFDISDK